MSIFDQLSGLIADSLLCPPLKFRGLSNYRLRSGKQEGGGALCLVLIGSRTGASAQRRAPITENY